MKNSMKLVFSVLCVALCAVALSCASSGGGGGASAATGETVPYVGEWEGYTDVNDGGDSTIEVEKT